MRHWRILTAFAAVLVLGAVALRAGAPYLVHLGARASAAPAASFVGSGACQSCHTRETEAWSRSHHRAAMAAASDSTVLGNFNGGSLRVGAITNSFFKRDGKFFARTDGPDGKLADFEIKYTFGVYPLQQYLVAMPGGRLQALTLAWDSRPTQLGGQRWFQLFPDSHSSDDELHWTRPAQNWNYMCADCHSTAVRKNYDATSDAFHTTWAEISVGCEACHGPGSRHLAWAAERRRGASTRSADASMGLSARLDERRGVRWIRNETTGIATRSTARVSDRELQMCAQCHSRRRQLADGYVAGKSFYDFYRPALLTSPLYHADGQQHDEVYEWGSFLQSRMNARGVTCSDCHEPHSGRLRAAGSTVCARCHSPDKYESPHHDHHAAGAGRPTCLSCHMPSTAYMQIDLRRDHSFRVPRPDLTVQLGTPNACTTCHADRAPRWAAAQITSWRSGDSSAIGFQRFAHAFAFADAGVADASHLLSAVATDTTQPAIARATALAEYPARDDRESLIVLSLGLNDPSPLVRLGALRGLNRLPLERRAALVTPLLADSMMAVRVDASRLQVGAAVRSSAQQASFDRAVREWIGVQLYDADRSDARTNLGTFYAERGDLSRAEAELRAAIRVDPFFPPAYANLADVLRATGQARDDEAEQVLRAGLSRAPSNAGLRHALGLALVRLQRRDEALTELRRAAQLEPGNVRFGYVYAVALNSAGRIKESITELDRVLTIDPGDRDVLGALVAYHQAKGEVDLAKKYEVRLQSLPASAAERTTPR
jgi:tetratricopeptide (TPR) repeat protein